MLASTVQFSTYDQTPPTRPRQTRHSHRRPGGTRNRKALPEKKRPSPTGERPALSGPNSVPTTGHPPPPAFHTPEGAVLAAMTTAGRTGQRSTLEHHPRSCATRRE
jgi:hypothetical protein